MKVPLAIASVLAGLVGAAFWQLDKFDDKPVSDKPDASVHEDLGPVQEITCEGVNGAVCDLRANNLCGEGNWVPVAYPGDPFAMAHWIHDAGCYTGQSMLVRCK